MSEATVLTALLSAVQESATHAANAEAAPAAILWPDQARHWGPAVARLRGEAPILALGAYAPVDSSGPAYFVRCIVDGGLPAEVDGTPIVYLPGYGRSDIRAVEDANQALKPLAELQ